MYLSTYSLTTTISLLYINHSCNPSVRFEVSGSKDTWKAVAERDIPAGEALSFCEYARARTDGDFSQQTLTYATTTTQSTPRRNGPCLSHSLAIVVIQQNASDTFLAQRTFLQKNSNSTLSMSTLPLSSDSSSSSSSSSIRQGDRAQAVHFTA